MSFTREGVLSALGQAYTEGMKMSELATELGVKKKDQHRLRKLVTTLVGEGVIQRVGRATYSVASPASVPGLVGRISVHPAGYGFVELDDGSNDVFVPAKYRGNALDGDRVILETWEGYKGVEGRVQAVLARGRAKLTGTLCRAGHTVFVEPDDPRISTDYGHVGLIDGHGGAREGEAVVVEISRYPDDARPELAGRITRVLGDPEDPRTEIEKIIVCADIPFEFPEEAEKQAEETPQEVSTDDLADRIDLRDRPFVTIDPETARDFDDALCYEAGPHGPRVWVAVADVSHYVAAEDALDREAQIRGVSCYLPDRVIPMLPFPLSSGICSLNPEVDRCAMVVRLDYDDEGTLRDTGFAAAVIRSHARLDYPGVAAALTGDFRGRREHYRKWAGSLRELDHLAQKLRARRMARGSLDLDIAEAKVILDDDDPRLVRDVVQSKGSEDVRQAYRLVEEFMIAANEAVGAFFAERELTTIWRIHAPPDEARVEELGEVLAQFGIDVDVRAACTPRGMKDVLAQLEGKPAQRSLAFLVLRSLTQAVYDTNPIGHFGLASKHYLHFTSPIRRYPDLVAHRLLKYYLHREGQASGGAGHAAPPSTERLAEIAGAISGHERRAMEAEREAVSMYRAFLMREHIGEYYEGTVTGVTHFGAFVEIDQPFVEGLIKTETLGDERFEYDDIALTLRGKRSGFTIALGDLVNVEVTDASIVKRRVDFGLLEVLESPARPKRGRRRRRRSAASDSRKIRHTPRSKNDRGNKGGRAKGGGGKKGGGKGGGGKKGGGKRGGGKQGGGRRGRQ